jgi:hypothetical protein
MAAVFSLLVSAACSTDGGPTTAPTQILIPSVPTITPEPPAPTVTPPALPAPADVAATEIAPTSLPDNAQALLSLILDDLAGDLRIDSQAINVALIETAVWLGTNLGCDMIVPTDLDEGISGYRVVLLVDSAIYEYHTDSSSQFLRCDLVDPTAAATLAVGALLAIDPIAAELATLAQRRVADELDLPLRRVDVIGLRAITWTESSLGCPQPDQTYTPVEIDGYRIVISAAENLYIFHSDSERLALCAPEDELLP